MIDAAPSLRAMIPGVTVDAVPDRSAIPGPDIIAGLAATGRLHASIVFDLGTNGGFGIDVLNRVLAIAAGRRVVMVTSHCPYCSSIAAANAIKLTHCTANRHCYVADWNRLANLHPEWFAADGVHMAIESSGVRHVRYITT
jgi:hypothetical protein